MLPKDLLVVNTRNGKIVPQYAEPDHHLPLAKKVLGVFKQGKGKKQKFLMQRLKRMEEYETYKILRGLTELLKRRCGFEADYVIPPLKIRRKLFERGFVTSQTERKLVISDVAEKFDITRKEVENSFWADLDQEKVLKEFHPLEPKELLKAYNLSLTQTMLFDAHSMRVRVNENYQEIFHRIKLFGLMYLVEKVDDKFHIEITGPASLFRKTRKYGVKMAKLLPSILKAENWMITAKIERDRGDETRLYDFKLDSSSRNKLGVGPVKKEEEFDSMVEEDFARKLKGIAKEWTVKREPSILKAGKRVIIPDFLLKKRSMRKYVEIVGFWTKRYLKHKLEKLGEIKKDILLFVNKNLQCRKTDFHQKPENILFYNRRVSSRKILTKLREFENELRKKETKKLDPGTINLEEGKTVEEIARKLEVSSLTVKEIIQKKIRVEGRKGTKWYLVDGRITRESTLKSLKQRISNLSQKNYQNVKKILKEFGFGLEALEKIGYKVKWSKLDPSKARITKTS